MKIEIINCNNIDQGVMEIEEGKLNIKFGSNGTGKSTISNAIDYSIRAPEEMKRLLPFKFRSPNEGAAPEVKGAGQFKSIMIFDEAYINQFAFVSDEVLKDSFDIFIKHPEYDRMMEEIELSVSKIRGVFSGNQDIDKMISDLQALSESFGKAKSGFSCAGRIGKGLANGNKLDNIPEKLVPFETLIKSEKNVDWIQWQLKGVEFWDVSTGCPFCTTTTEGKEEIIRGVGEEYDSKSIGHLKALMDIIKSLGDYFSDSTRERLERIVKTSEPLSAEQIGFLVSLKDKIEPLLDKLKAMRELSFYSLKDADQLQNVFSPLRIDMTYLEELDSQKASQVVEAVNGAIDSTLKEIGVLKGSIERQKKAIGKAIKENREDINEFLRYAGYKYVVDAKEAGSSFTMSLKHVDNENYLEQGKTHLSYGEKNAFSLVLFMFECLQKKPDLIILDDPISSFDKNKKFAIMDKLFKKGKSLKGQTVLMLTHDFEPIVDIVKTLRGQFDPVPSAYFLRNSGGVLTECRIDRDDIKTFSQICPENIAKVDNNIIKCIYLRRRFEILNSKGDEYQVLSNLLHKRDVILERVDGDMVEMSPERIKTAIEEIRKHVANFDYSSFLAEAKDRLGIFNAYKAADNGYEKLQLFRVLFDGHDNAVINKYINEVYHIENDYIMQLNPHQFDMIPEFIIHECDAVLKDEFEGNSAA